MIPQHPTGAPHPADSLTSRGRATRARLVAAARRTFEREGFLDTRVADIVAEAGMAHGTFYLYFTSKEDVFIAVVNDHLATIRSDAEILAPGGGPAEVIAAVNHAYVQAWSDHHRLMAAWAVAASQHQPIAALLEARTSEAIERTRRLLIRLQESGRVPRGLDPQVAAHALNSMVLQVCLDLFSGEDPSVDVDLVASTLTRLWVQGIGLTPTEPPQGKARS